MEMESRVRAGSMRNRLLLQLLVAAVVGQAVGEVTVRTALGPIRGIEMSSFGGHTIYAFRGIPYAQPPVGGLRFRAPQPIQPWGETPLNASSDALICPQTGIASLMSEDCLKLNVYSRSLVERRPVIVYIHGGANVLGSGHSVYEAGPQYLLDHDVVLVSFNYRLGALGFLGGSNHGYLDQILALRWVQSHLSHFGGDPGLVTILGLSAGAMAVSLHLASPLSRGLFHRAVLMSGSATNHFDIHNELWTRRLARGVGCPLYDASDRTECLRNVTWQRIVEVCAAWEQYKFINMKWNYEIDGHFLPDHPSSLIARGDFSRVPLLVSYTDNELDFTTTPHLQQPLLLDDIGRHFEDYAPELFLFDSDRQKSEQIWDFYLGRSTDQLNASNIERFGQIFSDGIIGHGVYRLVNLARRHTKVYYSRMDYIGQSSVSAPSDEDGRPRGVGHADDWQYLMPSLWYGPQFGANHSDVFMVKRMTQWIAHFALTGVPTNSSDVQWPPCNASSMQLLYNDKIAKVGPPAYLDQYALWDGLFPHHRTNAAGRSQLQLASVVFGVALLRVVL